ncbi:MAG: hypothetical protein IIA14_15595 [SAR324 cluster bacterium]|nr:hypothetical protein [SAR324 cluster bacterium]
MGKTNGNGTLTGRERFLNALAGHPGAFPIAHWREIAERVASGDVPPGILITMGAGDIAGLGPLLLGRGAVP